MRRKNNSYLLHRSLFIYLFFIYTDLFLYWRNRPILYLLFLSCCVKQKFFCTLFINSYIVKKGCKKKVQMCWKEHCVMKMNAIPIYKTNKRHTWCFKKINTAITRCSRIKNMKRSSYRNVIVVKKCPLLLLLLFFVSFDSAQFNDLRKIFGQSELIRPPAQCCVYRAISHTDNINVKIHSWMKVVRA